MQEQGYEIDGNGKPIKPKTVLENALREVRRKRSSAIFREIAENVSFSRCVDAAFMKLKDQLQSWFGTVTPN